MTPEERKIRRNIDSANWRKRHPEKRKASLRRYAARNRDDLREYLRLYQLAFPEKILARVKRYQSKNPELVRKRSRLYRRNNPEKVRISKRISKQRLIAKSLNAKIKFSLRGRLGCAFRRGKAVKLHSTLSLLGCSIESFRIYLESLWETEMSWENYGKGPGKWQIDHIMPCAIFDLTKPEHQKRCFHFSNLQPMWARDNFRKGVKVLTNQFNLL